jgi:hypothetical protein
MRGQAMRMRILDIQNPSVGEALLNHTFVGPRWREILEIGKVLSKVLEKYLYWSKIGQPWERSHFLGFSPLPTFSQKGEDCRKGTSCS